MVYINIGEYYSAIKGNLAIDDPGGHYAKWHKPDTEQKDRIVWSFICGI